MNHIIYMSDCSEDPAQIMTWEDVPDITGATGYRKILFKNTPNGLQCFDMDINLKWGLLRDCHPDDVAKSQRNQLFKLVDDFAGTGNDTMFQGTVPLSVLKMVSLGGFRCRSLERVKYLRSKPNDGNLPTIIPRYRGTASSSHMEICLSTDAYCWVHVIDQLQKPVVSAYYCKPESAEWKKKETPNGIRLRNQKIDGCLTHLGEHKLGLEPCDVSKESQVFHAGDTRTFFSLTPATAAGNCVDIAYPAFSTNYVWGLGQVWPCGGRGANQKFHLTETMFAFGTLLYLHLLIATEPASNGFA